jgi:hypothetical protein
MSMDLSGFRLRSPVVKPKSINLLLGLPTQANATAPPVKVSYVLRWLFQDSVISKLEYLLYVCFQSGVMQ